MAGNTKLIEQYKKIHSKKTYGNTSVKNLRFIRPDIKILHPESVIDYGCGQSPLLEELSLGYEIVKNRYDPAIPEFSKKPDIISDLLLNVDVLEHIEEEDLDIILAEMRSLCKNALIIVDLKEAELLLEDGRNAHVTIKPAQWWEEKISKHFGKLKRIKVARSSRAAFKTWDRSPIETFIYYVLRFRYSSVYYVYRLFGKRKY
jgi:hypothetical protein